MRFDCRVQTQDLLSSTAIDPQALAAQLTEEAFGQFDVSFSFRTSDFSTALTDDPLQVVLGKAYMYKYVYVTG